MGTVTVAGRGTSEEPRTTRYRETEDALWHHYGLDPVERFVELDSPPLRVRITEVGSGRPVLFVHGTAGTGPVWAPLLRELEGFRCLVLDRPGWAFSSPLDYSRHEYGAVVSEVLNGALDALEIDRTDVVGASVGDLWALRFGSAHPERGDRIALLGGGPLVPGVGVPPFIRLLASPVGAAIVRLPLKPDRVRSILRDAGHGASLDDGRISDEFVDWRASLGRETDSMRHERDMVRAIVKGRGYVDGLTLSARELATIRQPTLLAYGTEDPVGSLDIWTGMVETLPKGELFIVQGGGHMPWLDDPRLVGQRLTEFLRG